MYISRRFLLAMLAFGATLLAGCASAPNTPRSAAATPHIAAPAPEPAAVPAAAPSAPPEPPQARAEPSPAPPADLRIVVRPGLDLPDARERRGLEDIAEQVKARRGASLSIESYSSWHGSREFNMALAQQRADDIREALVKLGVPPGRILATAYGEERKSRSHAEQSRIDIRIIRPASP